jgi:glycolate oxidase FAD binding subunit
LRDQINEFFIDRNDGTISAPLWRVSVPATHPPLDLSGQVLIEWGGAQRWYWTDESAERVRETAARAGGHASVFRAPKHMADFLAPLPPPLERIHRALKQSFDPAGIFNRGRLYPWM